MRKIDSLVIHCSDSPWGDAAVIRDWHKQRGWRDIGYHAVILNGFRWNSTGYQAVANGLIEPGRDHGTQGAHVKGHNRATLGVCLIGVDDFTPAQFDALWRIVGTWRALYGVPLSGVYGHRELDSGKTCPNFDVQDWLTTRAG